MKFVLLGDWPVTSGLCIPAGTILDGENLQWNGMQLPTPLPMNAKALDQPAYDAMVRWYEPHTDDFLHLLHFSKGVNPKKGI